MRSWRAFAMLAQRTGPYLLIELVMPGGTLLALLLFLYQRRQPTGLVKSLSRLASAVVRTVDRVFAWSPMPLCGVLQPATVRACRCQSDGLEPLAFEPMPCRYRVSGW